MGCAVEDVGLFAPIGILLRCNRRLAAACASSSISGLAIRTPWRSLCMTPHHVRESPPGGVHPISTPSPLSTSLSRIMRPDQSNGSRGLNFVSRMQRPMANNGMMDGHKVMGIENRGRPMLPMRDAGGWGNRLDANKVGTESPRRPISPAFRS